jgi:nicotinamidase-related amidase
VVIEDACRAIDIEGSLDAAMAAMLGTGVDIIQSKEIVAIN